MERRETNIVGKQILLEDFLIIVLFLFAVDFLDMSGILLILFLFGFAFLNITTDIEFDSNAVILLVFSVFYFFSLVIYEGVALDSVFKFLIAPWAIYVFGYNYVGIQGKMTVTNFTYLMTFGFFLHGMLNLMSSINVYGFDLNSNYRRAFDFWQHRNISVTTAALYYSPFALVSVCALFLESRKKIKILAVVSVALSVLATFTYQNRTLLMALAICSILSILAFSHDKSVDYERKKKMWTFIAWGVCLIGILFLLDVFGIRSWLENTNLANRVGGEKQDRSTIWLSFWKANPFRYPFGGTKVILYSNKPFVHNMWFDTFRRTGIIPFMMLIVFTVNIVRTSMVFLKSGNKENGNLVSVFVLGLLALCMVEPIIEANPYFFYIPIIVTGAAKGTISRQEQIMNEV